jgi:hypothetical protein
MAFKENLLQKIRIDALAARVLASIGPEGGDAKLDRPAMRELLALSPYTPQRERDLDLYVNAADAARPKVLVLDNELPIYRTSVQDVAMRKSPEVREMVSLGNIIKILKDSDVKISRKADSLKTVQEESIARLDLAFDAEEIQSIRRDGIASIESRYADGVNESLALFAELLGYRVPPKPFVLPHCTVYAALYRRDNGETVAGPAVAFDLRRNRVRLTDEQFGAFDRERVERFHRFAAGDDPVDAEGAAVFERLQTMVLSSRAGGN